MHIAGENDELVPYRFQVRTMTAVRRVNGCNDTAAPWATAGPLTGVIYASPSGTPFVALTHPGSHKFPEAAPELVVRFFKEHAKP
ncbi:MAG: hypothetical protein FJY92_08510 [Candidatus Hydrogenedentes bacterium]|nr:hypothetical protein [Candidatus Hydrogenedentota bacterium]